MGRPKRLGEAPRRQNISLSAEELEMVETVIRHMEHTQGIHLSKPQALRVLFNSWQKMQLAEAAAQANEIPERVSA